MKTIYFNYPSISLEERPILHKFNYLLRTAIMIYDLAAEVVSMLHLRVANEDLFTVKTFCKIDIIY